MNFNDWLVENKKKIDVPIVLVGALLGILGFGLEGCIAYYHWVDDQDYGYAIVFALGMFALFVLLRPAFKQYLKIRKGYPSQRD